MRPPAGTTVTFLGTAGAVPDPHASLREDRQASTAMLDRLPHESTQVLRKDPDVHGARLTGANATRNDACVALCRTGTAAAAGRRAVKEVNARVNAGSAAATLLIPASTPSQDHNKRGSDE